MKANPQFDAAGSSRIRLFVLLVCGIAISGLLARSAPAPNSSGDDRRGQISVVSELVVVPVNVTDTNGDFVPGLKQDNFRIYEGDRLQTISVFQQEDAPVSVGLLVDHSGSMGSKLPNVVSAVTAFAQASNPRDEMFVVNFRDDVTVALPAGKAFTNNPMEIERAISATSALGRTALYDAVVAGLSHLQLAHWQKKALLIVSDGGDNASRYKYSQVLAMARQFHVTIYSIGLVDESGEEQNPRALEQLCKETSGIAFFPRSAAQVVGSSANVARDLQEQYTLGFEPAENGNAGAFHKIQIHVAAPHRGKLKVRTRAGYTRPASATSAGPDKDPS
jgi:Ca-activated chloride channel homolog